MKNVDYHLTDDIIVHVARLNGKLVGKQEETVDFDNRHSFGIDINSASVFLSLAVLSNDLNEYVFARPDAPLKRLSASAQGSELTMKGVLTPKGGEKGIPFESTGTLSVTPEGAIRIHTTKVKALHLPVKGLMDVLGIETATLLNTNKVEGVRVDKDDLILDPEYILPPPRLRGHVTAIAVQNEGLLLTFGKAESEEHQPATSNTCGARNYLQFRGGSVHFGKLTMADTDLVLLDMQPADAFDFSFDHYKEQLVKGYSKTTPQNGLCVHMPDFDKLNEHGSRK